MRSERYGVLDGLRGFLLISMILYHGLWDLEYIFGIDVPEYESVATDIWQQCLCWTFILLSGFCWNLGRKKCRRAIEVMAASSLISIVTIIVMPENRVLFGVLSVIGTGMFLMILLDKCFCRWNPYLGATLSFGLFILLRNINFGTLGFGSRNFIELPKGWYANLFTAYLGCPPGDFWSSDYFSVFPWIFLYITGYFLYFIVKDKNLWKYFKNPRIKCLEFLGRHSLWVYLLHQPVVYGLLYVLLE